MILILFDYHLQNHIDRNSDITVSCVPVGERYAVTSIFGAECPFLNKLRFSFLIRNFRFLLHIMAFLSRASDYGLMKIDSRGRVIQFWEKPKGTELEAMVGQPIHMMLSNVLCVSCLYNWKGCTLNPLMSVLLQRVDTQILGLSQEDALSNPYIASMGVYVFRTDVLLKLLTQTCPKANDFGFEILPSAVKDQNIQVYNSWSWSLWFFFSLLPCTLKEVNTQKIRLDYGPSDKYR